jgi:transcriptional regulator with XRE-family HTH domain
VDGIGERIRQLRTSQNIPLSQAKLAAHLGVAVESVSRWERGAQLPTLTHLQRLAEIFEVPLADFFVSAS